MNKSTVILLSILFISACSNSPPEPKNWKDDLGSVKEEPINNNIDQLNRELNNPNVWSK